MNKKFPMAHRLLVMITFILSCSFALGQNIVRWNHRLSKIPLYTTKTTVFNQTATYTAYKSIGGDVEYELHVTLQYSEDAIRQGKMENYVLSFTVNDIDLKRKQSKQLIITGTVKGPVNASQYWFPHVDIGTYVFPKQTLPYIIPH